MKTMTKKKIALIILLAAFLFLVGIFLITDTLPVVIINNKPYFVFTSEMSINETGDNVFTNDDIEKLKKMKWLESFRLYYSEITDVSFLSEMSQLKILLLTCDDAHPIDDLTSIQYCKQLERFIGVNLNITDLSDFKQLKNLNSLYIYSDIKDISDLKYLSNLEILCIQSINITDISALKNCDKLKTLTLRDMPLTDCATIFELPKLEFLGLDKGMLTETEIKALEEKGVEVYEYENSD